MPGGWRLGAHERCAERPADRGSRPGDRPPRRTLRTPGRRDRDRATARGRRRRRLRAHRRAPHAGSPPPSVSSRRRRPATAASSCCWPVPRRSPPPANSARATRALLESMNIVRRGSGVVARPPHRCVRARRAPPRPPTEAHAHLETALAELRIPYRARRRADDRARRRQPLPRGLRRDARLGEPRSRSGRATRRRADRGGARRACPGERWRESAAKGRRYRAEAAALIDSLADDELEGRLDALAHLATAEFYLDHFAATAPTPSAPCESVARPGRAISSRSSSRCSEAASGFEAGWTEAGEVLDGAIAAARLVDNPQGLAWNLFNRSYAAFAAGDIDLALATAKEAFDLALELDEGPVPAHAAVALADARFETGHPARAPSCWSSRRRGRAAVDRRRLAGEVPRASHPFLPRGGPARRSRARGDGGAGLRRSRRPPDGGRDGRPRRRSDLDLDGGEPARAAGARFSRAGLEEVGNVFDAATSRLLAGRALAQAGERDRAAASWSAQRRRSSPSARTATETRPNGSSGGSDVRSTGARGRARETGRASTHSPSANSRSHDSSSTERPTPRSRPSSSSARRPSKPTCATPSASSASHRASKWPGPSSAPIDLRFEAAPSTVPPRKQSVVAALRRTPSPADMRAKPGSAELADHHSKSSCLTAAPGMRRETCGIRALPDSRNIRNSPG